MTNEQKIKDLMTEVVDRTDYFTKQLLSRVMYHKWCDYKNVTPRPYPYADAGSQDYASTAVDMLGYDDASVTDMIAFLRDRGDRV